MTATISVMLLVAVAVPLALMVEIDQAGKRLQGQARVLAEFLSAEAYGLHHWLHEERMTAALTQVPAAGAARPLSAVEREGRRNGLGGLGNHSATTTNGWRTIFQPRDWGVPVPRGWEIVRLVGRPGEGQLPDGVIVLRPNNDVVNGPTWAALNTTLDGLLPDDAMAAGLARAVGLTPPFDPARDRALMASRFARLDSRAVLREAHVGHPALPMAVDLDLNGNSLLALNTLQSVDAAIPTLTGPLTAVGRLTADAGLTVDFADPQAGVTDTTLGGFDAEDVTLVQNNVTGITSVRTATAEITGTLRAAGLTACADERAILCGGGDIDLTAATGTPDWTTATIFGDVTIRDGNRLDGVTTVTARTGVFDAIAGAPAPGLTVSDCFRSTEPFVHGDRC